ncbi:hypothetical protein CBS9595_001558 [Malassezia furfur]|nr:hypothetical protein CBS9595_001558 [Malassezia furfur]
MIVGRLGLRAAPRALGACTPAAARAAGTSAAQNTNTLPWSTYLQMRRQRRLAGLISTVPTMAIAAIASGSYFMTLEIDPSKTIAGIDPLFVHIGATLACTAVGWLVGPSLGVGVWTLLHRSRAAQFAQRDREFYTRIKRLRADPTRQVVHNPVPDYYGESIGSIHQYRQWLRDQAIYRRKAQHGIEDP